MLDVAVLLASDTHPVTSRFACPLPVCGSARLDIVCVDVIQTWHCFVSFALCSAALGAHVWTSVPILLTSFTHYYFLHIRYAYFALFLLAICIRDSISHSNVCVYNIGTTRCCWRSSSLTHPSSVHLFSQEQWCCMSLFQEEWPIILLMSKPITQPAKSQMTVSTLFNWISLLTQWWCHCTITITYSKSVKYNGQCSLWFP